MNCHDIEPYLSGYLDSELIQQEAQRVEIHLSECSHCRRVLSQLSEVQKATGQIPVKQPSREEWAKMEGHILSRMTRGLGWLIIIVWSTVTLAYSLFQYALSPADPLFHKILVFGLFLGIALLFFSVLIERVRESRTDRYKGVLK